MKKLKQIILVICILIVACLLNPQNVSAASHVASGTCGDNLKWYLYDDGSLVINGTGAMTDFVITNSSLLNGLPTARPWEDYIDKVKSISIGEGVTSIGKYAFNDMKYLQEISISSTVTDIGYYSFFNCILLEEVIVPNNVETIGTAAFKDCVSLEKVYLSRQIMNAPYLFYGCTSLTDVAMPKMMSRISEFMFYGCSSLEEIWVDETVKCVGNNAFKNCSKFKEIKSDPTLANIETVEYNAFENCTALTDIIDEATSIGHEAYKGCSGLESVTFNGTSLGEGAFADCRNLKKAYIGKNVPLIKAKTFQNDYSLTYVEISGDTTRIADSTVFNGCSSSLQVDVPDANTEVINYLKNNGITRYESIFGGGVINPGAAQVAGGPVDNARWINSNHSVFYSGKKCSTSAIKTEGEARPNNPFYGPYDIIIHYSDSNNITKENYESFPTSITTKANAGIYKTYAYGKYIDLGVMYCAVAKAEPKVKLSNVSLAAGKTKTLGLSVSGSPKISYQSLNSSVATISSTGKITAKKSGTATIRVYVAPTKNYRAVVKQFKVTVLKKQTITASSKTVAYKSSAFSLNAKASGGGKLTYSSSNKNVATVSSTGKVTPKGYGKATITIKAAAKGNYQAATKKITIKVIPKKVVIASCKSPSKRKMVIKWGKDTTVTGYEINVSTNKGFSSNTMARTCGKSVASTEVPSLKSGKTYYVRVRAYKIVNGARYNGNWSAVKSVKVK